MTCDQYEDLLARAQLACERCRLANEFLYIDHDHRQQSAVRGILCPKCNRHLSFVEAGRKPLDDLTARYLARPFVELQRGR